MSQPSEVFIGRQPIFDRDQRVVAYEVLFRSGDVNAAHVLDGSTATATVMLNALTEIGLDRLVGSRVGWINLTREAALSGLGLTLPAPATCFEILEGQEIDDELIEAVAELSERGYKIALDDFEFTPDAEPLLPFADYVKLDLLALGRDGFAEQMKRLESYGVKILAEKVETRDEHEFSMDLGCDLFQGFFYQKPEILRERRIELNRGSMFQIISAMQDPYIQLEDLEPLIAHDVPLSLRLLRYLNSAFLGLAREVSSVKQGLILLGIDNVRRWATLTAMTSLEGKTAELTDAALLRARFCELAGVDSGLDGSEAFTVGLFSLIDTMMDTPLEEVLQNLPFPREVRCALLNREGRMGEILNAAIALEGGSPAEAGALVEGASTIYVEALLWAQEAIATLSDSMAIA